MTPGDNDWLKTLLDDHSSRLVRIEDKVTVLTGKIYGMAAAVSIGVSLITAVAVSLIAKVFGGQ